MNAAYVRGFVDKCASAGIDPDILIKLADGYADLAKQILPDVNAKGITGQNIMPYLKQRFGGETQVEPYAGEFKPVDTTPSTPPAKQERYTGVAPTPGWQPKPRHSPTYTRGYNPSRTPNPNLLKLNV